MPKEIIRDLGDGFFDYDGDEPGEEMNNYLVTGSFLLEEDQLEEEVTQERIFSFLRQEVPLILWEPSDIQECTIYDDDIVVVQLSLPVMARGEKEAIDHAYELYQDLYQKTSIEFTNAQLS